MIDSGTPESRTRPARENYPINRRQRVADSGSRLFAVGVRVFEHLFHGQHTEGALRSCVASIFSNRHSATRYDAATTAIIAIHTAAVAAFDWPA